MIEKRSFDQSRYWVERHESYRGDPRSVGTLALSLEENLHGEQKLVDAIKTIAGDFYRPSASVLDLGCGYGRVARAFISAGFSYTGYDVSPVAIERARQENPGGSFEVKDLLAWLPTREFDLVSVLFVFVHFVVDEEWERFLDNAIASVKPGGVLMIADEFPAQPRRAQHYVARPLEFYQSRLAGAGVRLRPDITASVVNKLQGNSIARFFHFASKD